MMPEEAEAVAAVAVEAEAVAEEQLLGYYLQNRPVNGIEHLLRL